MIFFTKYCPTPCDKKCCSEHQTLFHFSGGLGMRLDSVLAENGPRETVMVSNVHLGSYLDPGVLNFCFSCPLSSCPPMEGAGVAGWLASGGAGVLVWGFLPNCRILSSRRLISFSDNCSYVLGSMQSAFSPRNHPGSHDSNYLETSCCVNMKYYSDGPPGSSLSLDNGLQLLP